MDANDLSKRYMEKYNELVKRAKESDIDDKILSLNDAIKNSNMNEINQYYNEIMDWNATVEKIEGARIAIDAQYKYLHLPSPMMYCIIFDWEYKEWRFNLQKN